MSSELAIALLVMGSAFGIGVGVLAARAHAGLSKPPKALVPVRPEVQVARISDSVAFELPTDRDDAVTLAVKAKIRDLFERAFADPEHADPGPALEWCGEHAGDPCFAVLVAFRDDGPFAGVAILSDWPSPFAPDPWCVHFYGPGRDVRIALGTAMGEWALARGHDRFVAINRTGVSDARWLAAHRHTSRARVVASYGEFVYRGAP